MAGDDKDNDFTVVKLRLAMHLSQALGEQKVIDSIPQDWYLALPRKY
jgi:hypothetical protein